MVYLNRVVSRQRFFWDEVNEDKIKAYIKELEGNIEELRNEDTTQSFFGIHHEEIQEIVSMLKNEVKKAKFYFEYLERQNEDNFDKWIFVKKEDRKEVLGDYEWNVYGDCWIRTNGKIQVKIEFDTRKIMTKIILSVKNDSNCLTFYERPYEHKNPYCHVKNEEKITQRVNEYKQQAEKIFKKYQYPRPRYYTEKRELDLLNKLLHVKDD